MNEDALRRYLQARALRAGSQKNLAAQIGEHRATLTKIINGERQPTQKVLDYFGLELGYEFVKLPKQN